MEPCVLVASACESLQPDVVIKGILGTENLPEPLNLTEGVRSFPWHISTKYYDADIQVCALDRKTIASQAFADTVNAVVICFDTNAESKLKTVEQWLAFTKEFEAQIKILVCDQCYEDFGGGSGPSSVGVSRFEAQTWCVRNGFELVELNPIQDDEDSDVDDDFPESVGMPRVIQALQAHLWPNLKLKGSAEGQILPPHAGLQHIVNGFSPQDNISRDAAANDFDKEVGTRKEKEIKVAKVKPMPKLVSSEDEGNIVGSEGSSSGSNSVGSNKTQESHHQREVQFHSQAAIKVANSSSSNTTTSSAAHCEPSAPLSSSSPLPACNSSNTREIGIVPPLEVPDGSSKQPDEPETSSKSQRPASHPPAPHRDDRIDSMLEALDSMSEDNFEQLFQNLSVMKSKAANLSPTGRKAYAEKMAMAFWRSVGGDEAEIADLSSGEED